MMKLANDRNCEMGVSVKGFEISLECWWQLDSKILSPTLYLRM